MSWSKIKNIMIIILVIMNVFLIADICLTKYASMSIPDKTSDAFLNILERKNITLAENVVPTHYERRADLSVSCYSPEEFSEMLIGKKEAFSHTENAIVASNDNGELKIEGNFVVFSSNAKTVKKNGEDILSALKNIGLDTKYAYFDETDGLVKCAVGAIGVSGVSLDVSLSENGKIASLAGIWLKIEVSGENTRASVTEAVVSILNRVPENAKITKIEQLYVFEYADNTALIINGWKIYADGKTYIVTE